MDILGLAKPLVDLGFNLAGAPADGGVLVSVTFSIGDKAAYDARAGTDLPAIGGSQIQIDALRTQQSRDAMNQITAEDEHLIVNVSDLEANGLTADSITPEHKAVLDDGTWAIVNVKPSLTKRTLDLRIRQ